MTSAAIAKALAFRMGFRVPSRKMTGKISTGASIPSSAIGKSEANRLPMGSFPFPRHQVDCHPGWPFRIIQAARVTLDVKVLAEAALHLARREYLAIGNAEQSLPPTRRPFEAVKHKLGSRVHERQDTRHIQIAVFRDEIVEHAIIHQQIKRTADVLEVSEIVHDEIHLHPSLSRTLAPQLNRSDGEIHASHIEAVLREKDGVAGYAAAEIYSAARLDASTFHQLNKFLSRTDVPGCAEVAVYQLVEQFHLHLKILRDNLPPFPGLTLLLYSIERPVVMGLVSRLGRELHGNLEAKQVSLTRGRRGGYPARSAHSKHSIVKIDNRHLEQDFERR